MIAPLSRPWPILRAEDHGDKTVEMDGIEIELVMLATMRVVATIVGTTVTVVMTEGIDRAHEIVTSDGKIGATPGTETEMELPTGIVSPIENDGTAVEGTEMIEGPDLDGENEAGQGIVFTNLEVSSTPLFIQDLQDLYTDHLIIVDGTPLSPPHYQTRSPSPRPRRRSRSPHHAPTHAKVERKDVPVRSIEASDRGASGDAENVMATGTDADAEADADAMAPVRDEDDADGDMEAQMQAMMGFGGFSTTKQKKIPGNNVYSVTKEKKTEYRQYMSVLALKMLCWVPSGIC